jgi:hypothetical protein
MRLNTPLLSRLLSFIVSSILIVTLVACTTPQSSPAPAGSNTTPTAGASQSPAASMPAPTNVTSPVASPSVLPTAVSTPPATTPVATTPVGISPTIRIIAPDDFPSYGATVSAWDLRVTVEVTGLNLVNRAGQAAAPGEGHILYYLDTNFPVTPGTSAVTAGGSYQASAATSVVWQNLPQGVHKVAVQLVNNDNTPLVPPVTDIVQTYVSYNASAPSLKITSPVVGASLAAGNVTIQVALRNFISVDNSDKANIFGEGHIIYYMDVDPPIISSQISSSPQTAIPASGAYVSSAATNYTWHNVPAGVHTFSVQLVNNDNTPIALPYLPAVDKVKVTLQ